MKKKNFLIFVPAILLTIIFIILAYNGQKIAWWILATQWTLSLGLFVSYPKR